LDEVRLTEHWVASEGCEVRIAELGENSKDFAAPVDVFLHRALKDAAWIWRGGAKQPRVAAQAGEMPALRGMGRQGNHGGLPLHEVDGGYRPRRTGDAQPLPCAVVRRGAKKPKRMR
jgi:hypothetical protein